MNASMRVQSPSESHMEGVEYRSFAEITELRMLILVFAAQVECFQKGASLTHVVRACASLTVSSRVWSEEMFSCAPR